MEKFDIFKDIDLFDCPVCGGPALLEEEYGWCITVSCLDCGCHTAELAFNNDEERVKAAKQAAMMWNIGKIIPGGIGE